MKQKGLAPILIVILIAVLAVGGFVFYSRTKPASLSQPQTPVVTSPTPQPTSIPSSIPNSTTESSGSAETVNPDSIGANWKIYTDKKYGFQIKLPPPYQAQPEYPAGCTATHCANNQNYKILFMPPPPTSDIFSLEPIPFTGTADEFANLIQSGSYQSAMAYFDRTQTKNTTVDGKQALWFQALPKNSPDRPYLEVYFTNGKYGFYLSGELTDHEKVFEDLLSTFKFTP